MNVYKVVISFNLENSLEKYNSAMILVRMYAKWWFSKRCLKGVRCEKYFFVMNEQLRLYLSEVFPGISYPYEGKTVLIIEK